MTTDQPSFVQPRWRVYDATMKVIDRLLAETGAPKYDLINAMVAYFCESTGYQIGDLDSLPDVPPSLRPNRTPAETIPSEGLGSPPAEPKSASPTAAMLSNLSTSVSVTLLAAMKPSLREAALDMAEELNTAQGLTFDSIPEDDLASLRQHGFRLPARSRS